MPGMLPGLPGDHDRGADDVSDDVRDELEAIKERRTHPHMCTPGCGGCGEMFAPVVDPDIERLVAALIEVDDLLDENDMANRYADVVHAPDHGHRECIDAGRLSAAVAGVLTETKGDGRG